MALLLNSVRHAAVSINVASTMSLESFAAGIPTINVAFRAILMYARSSSGTSRCIIRASIIGLWSKTVPSAIARSMDDLVTLTVQALEQGNLREAAMQRTLAQKVDYRGGAASDRFADVVERLADEPRLKALGCLMSLLAASPSAQSKGHYWPKQFLVNTIWFGCIPSRLVTLALTLTRRAARSLNAIRGERCIEWTSRRLSASKVRLTWPSLEASSQTDLRTGRKRRNASHALGRRSAQEPARGGSECNTELCGGNRRTRKTGHRIARGIRQFAESRPHVKFDRVESKLYF